MPAGARKFALALAVVLSAMPFAPQALASHMIVVDDDWPTGDFCNGATTNSIQAAVNAADPGTRISICPGTYTEEVVIAGPAKNGIQLIGRGGRDNVVLDGVLGTGSPTGYNGIELSNVTDVVLRNFTVTRFHENIYLLAGADGNTVRHMVARGPSAHDGVRLDNAHGNLIAHNTIVANGVPPRGCGIDLLLGSSNNLVSHNNISQHDRAGIRVLGAGVGNVAAHNRAYLNGNGVFIQNTNGSVIEHNVLEDNFAQGDQFGIGIRMLAVAPATTMTNVVRKNQIEDNQRDGISLEDADETRSCATRATTTAATESSPTC